MAVVATCMLIGSGVLAGTGAASSPRAARVTAPKLIAHDVSGFAGKTKHATARRGPQIYKAHNDSVASDSDPFVLNPTGDIGRTQYVYAQNGEYWVDSRVNNALLAGVGSAGFWSGLGGSPEADLCSTDLQGEPSIAYDQLNDRWVIAEAAYAGGASPVAPFVECVAVSTGPDATGTWARYVFSVSDTLFPNRPTLGIWSDGYYLSFNQHTAGGTWAGAGALALQSSQMLLGLPAQSRYFDDAGFTPRLGGMLPANVNGPTAPDPGAPELYLQAHDDPLNQHDRLEVWQFDVDWTVGGSSSFTPVINIPTNGLGGFDVDTEFWCTNPADVSTLWSTCLLQRLGLGSPQLQSLAQAYTDKPLGPYICSSACDTLPQLGGRLQWNSTGGTQTLTAVETVNDGANIAAPAWFKLTNPGSSWAIGAQGVYDPMDGSSRFLPSVALDNSGNVGLGYALTGPDGPPDPITGVPTPIRHETALGYADATNPGAYGDRIMVNGSGPYAHGDTWGRYTTLSLDPI
ncbi:MAG TPA: hypothetical protein VF379_01515, partial [Gaiellaceae bacterium]